MNITNPWAEPRPSVAFVKLGMRYHSATTQQSDGIFLNSNQLLSVNAQSLMIQNRADKDNWYFAYGSNLCKEQMLSRTGSIPASKVARLENYQFAFRRVLVGNDVFATIFPKQNSTVHGVVYQCSPNAMLQLDQFEGVAENCYRRASVRVTTQDGVILPCVVYIGQAFTEEFAPPSVSYWKLIQSGAQAHQLPVEYINALTRLAEKNVMF